MKIETTRLILRCFREEDVKDVFEYCSQQGIGEMAGWPAHISIDDTAKVLADWIKNENQLAIVWKQSRKVIGHIAINEDSEEGRQDTKELGCALNRDFQRQGIMSEVIHAVLDYLFQNHISYIWACCFRENAASKAMIEKCGFVFQQEGIFYSVGLNKTFLSYEYRITKEQWRSRGRNMGFFSRKPKEKQTAEPEKKIDVQECFRQNLKYISQTEINAEDIQRQFIKSDTRYYLTVGQVDCPTGKIVVSDPLCYLAAGTYCPTLAASILPGSYPAEVSICRNPFAGIRMCTARLKVKETRAVKYVCAEPTEKTAAGQCSDGVLTGFPVEAGMMSFCDEQAAEEYRRFLDNWHSENEGKNHYDDYLAGFFAKSEKALPAYQREGGDFIEWVNPDSGSRMVMIASGFGDGFYQSFWGYDKNNEICELIVPLVNPDLFE